MVDEMCNREQLSAAIGAALENQFSEPELDQLMQRVLSDRAAWAFFVRQVAAHKMLAARFTTDRNSSLANSRPAETIESNRDSIL
jgi:hypothetical protein